MLVDKYPSLFSYQKRVFAATGSPSSSCEMVILQCELRVMAKNITVCLGIFTIALRNKKIQSNSQ